MGFQRPSMDVSWFLNFLLVYPVIALSHHRGLCFTQWFCLILNPNRPYYDHPFYAHVVQLTPWGWALARSAFHCGSAHSLVFGSPCMNPVVFFRVSIPNHWSGGRLKSSSFVLGRLGRIFHYTSCSSIRSIGSSMLALQAWRVSKWNFLWQI